MAVAELTYTRTLLQSFQLWWALVKREKQLTVQEFSRQDFLV